MKPVRNILILLLVIAVLGVSYYAISRYEPEDTSTTLPTYTDAITIFETEKDSIVSISIKNAGEGYTLTKNGATWLANGTENIKLEQSLVNTFLYDCAHITAKEVIEENAQDLNAYGLLEPSRSVEIQTQDGRAVTVLIGNQSIEGSVCYIKLAKEHTVYAKNSSECNRLASSLSNLMNKTIYSLENDEIFGISIKRKGTDEISLKLVNTASNSETPDYMWQMEKPIKKDTDQYVITQEFLPSIAGLTAAEIIPIPVSGKNYGFENPEAEYSIWNSGHSKNYTVFVGKTEGDKTYVKLKNEQTVYTVENKAIGFLKLGFKDMVNSLVHTENLSEVSKIDINGLGKHYNILVQRNGESETYKLNGKNIEESKFKTAYQSIIGLMLDGYTKEKNAASPILTVSYTKTDGSKTVVSCINYDDRNYLVQVNGEGNLLVRKKQVESMFTQLDKTLAEA